MGVGPIPRSRIKSYAREELGLDGDAVERFAAVIAMVDSDYVGRANAVKDETSELPIRSMAKPTDGKAVGRILNNVAKKPTKPRARPVSDG